MPSLYDLLGALPGDDAGDLRKAFREAVKGVHPDIRPGDPEAALNFRLIVRAMEILADTDQRAAYDHLLEHARREFARERRAARLRNFAFAMIGLAGLSVVVVSLHVLFGPMAAVSPQVTQTDQLSRAPAGIASNRPSARPGDSAASRDADDAKPAETQDDFLERWRANEVNVPADRQAEEQPRPTSRLHANETDAAPGRKAEIVTPAKPRDDVPSAPSAGDNTAPAEIASNKPSVRPGSNDGSGSRDVENTMSAETQDDVLKRWGVNAINLPADRKDEAATESETPAVAAPGPAPPARHDDADGIKAIVEPHDTTDPSAAMHAQGILAYHNGDLKLALADFDRAIALNPTFMIAYIDRGIVLYRMGKLDRALADVARARQIGRAGHARAAAVLHRPECCVAAD